MLSTHSCIFFGSFITATFGTPAIYQVCPQQWIHFGQSCYTVPQDSKGNWVQSFDRCKSLSGELVVPNSRKENDLLWEIRQSTFKGNDKRVWLGCVDVENQGWVCIGDNLQENLTAAAANNDTSCAIHNEDFNIKWESKSCTKIKRNIICEKPLQQCVSPLHCFAIFSMDTGHVQPRCLFSHTYKEVLMPHPLMCCIACNKDPNCRSFNLSGKMCQLNNATIFQIDDDIHTAQVQHCVYYEY